MKEGKLIEGVGFEALVETHRPRIFRFALASRFCARSVEWLARNRGTLWMAGIARVRRSRAVWTSGYKPWKTGFRTSNNVTRHSGYNERTRVGRYRQDVGHLLPGRVPYGTSDNVYYVKCNLRRTYSARPTNFSATEFAQYRLPAGGGPSSNTCPRCASQSLQAIAVRLIPNVASGASVTFSRAIGSEKLGQPVPESNFTRESNSAVTQHTQR